MASLNRDSLVTLFQHHPGVFNAMRKKALMYDDPWKRFKEKLLRQVDYLAEQAEVDGEDALLEETQFNMEHQIYLKGSVII